MATILIAETDFRTLDHLPHVLSEQLPNVKVGVCTSAEDLTDTRKLSTYDAIAINPLLLHRYRSVQQDIDRYLEVPGLVTAKREECDLAFTYLQEDAFDLIVKPIVPQEAVQTVKVALWECALLRLLVSKDRATERFREHLKMFPHARKMEEELAHESRYFDLSWLYALRTL